MDKCSYFIKSKALFGCFPVQESVDELEEEGVRYFVNLTLDTESKIVPYTTRYNYIHFPIVDRRVPRNWGDFAKFIIRVSDIIYNLADGDMVYIHCRGGHGRSGVVVACLLMYMFNLSTEEALAQTTMYHSNRSVMRDKWRHIGSPQTKSQKNFVHKFFEPLYFYRAYKVGHTTGFSNFSLHPVNIPDFGDFPTSEAAIQAYKAPDNPDYVSRQVNSKSPVVSKSMGHKIIPSNEWVMSKDKLLGMILRKKFEQNDIIRYNLLNTGLRLIVEYKGDREFSGNVLGKLLTDIRNEYYSVN
jgi:predicted NAD-dependent protein-ADP-ribosyltransferase YbiA (DUF1768 family)